MANFTETQMLIFSLIGASNIVLIGAALTLLFSGRKVDKEERKIFLQKSVKNPVKKEPEIITDTFGNPDYDVNYVDENYYYDDEDYETIDEFEEEQEKTAIISYQELLQAKKEAVSRIEQPIETPKRKIEIEDDEEFISPVFGRMKSKPQTLANYETNNNQEFLRSLKEFRKNL